MHWKRCHAGVSTEAVRKDDNFEVDTGSTDNTGVKTESVDIKDDHFELVTENTDSIGVNSEAVVRKGDDFEVVPGSTGNTGVNSDVIDRQGDDFELTNKSADNVDMLEISSELSDEEQDNSINHSEEVENVRGEYY